MTGAADRQLPTNYPLAMDHPAIDDLIPASLTVSPPLNRTMSFEVPPRDWSLFAAGSTAMPTWLLREYLPVNLSDEPLRAGLVAAGYDRGPPIAEVGHWQKVAVTLTKIFDRQTSKALEVIEATVAQARFAETEDIDSLSERLAKLMDLLGEPAIVAARFRLSDAHLGRDASKVILSGLAQTNDPATSELRTKVIADCASSANRTIKYAAIGALGDLATVGAKRHLTRIAEHEPTQDLRRMATDILS